MDAWGILSITLPAAGVASYATRRAATCMERWVDASRPLPRPRTTRSAPPRTPSAPPSAAERARQMDAEGSLDGLSGAELARLLGVSERTGRRVLAGMRATQNGDGHDGTP